MQIQVRAREQRGYDAVVLKGRCHYEDTYADWSIVSRRIESMHHQC